MIMHLDSAQSMSLFISHSGQTSSALLLDLHGIILFLVELRIIPDVPGVYERPTFATHFS